MTVQGRGLSSVIVVSFQWYDARLHVVCSIYLILQAVRFGPIMLTRWFDFHREACLLCMVCLFVCTSFHLGFPSIEKSSSSRLHPRLLNWALERVRTSQYFWLCRSYPSRIIMNYVMMSICCCKIFTKCSMIQMALSQLCPWYELLLAATLSHFEWFEKLHTYFRIWLRFLFFPRLITWTVLNFCVGKNNVLHVFFWNIFPNVRQEKS